MSRLRRTFLRGGAEFVTSGPDLKLRVWGSTANGKSHEVVVAFNEHDDFPIALLIRSARAAIRRRREREETSRALADRIAEEVVDLRELPR